ncbi:hypothetical protein [Kitasatospora sp. MBT63]|uniref:hypothetical protein n=1 Tax=Kitasatospora sp. MBT63 TaxID=1444768 RepID=UPI00053BACAA|nr:hypothetical protein [Kitasatospora sp. MBT63]
MRINVRPAMGPVATIRGRDLRVVIDALDTHVREGEGLRRRASALLGELRGVEHRIPVQPCGCGADHHPADCPDAARRRGAGAEAP